MYQNDFPKIIRNIITAYEQKTGCSIECVEVPILEESENKLGCLELNENKVIIKIKSSISPERKKQTYIHELLHLKLYLEGYPTINFPINLNSIRILANHLKSLLDHYVIFPIEKSLGYDVVDSELGVASLALEKIEKINFNDLKKSNIDSRNIFSCQWGVVYARAVLFCPKSENGSILISKFNESRFMRFKEIGENIIKRITDSGLSDAKVYRQVLSGLIIDVIKTNDLYIKEPFLS